LSKLKNNNVKKDLFEPKVEKTIEVAKDTSDMFARYFKKTPKSLPAITTTDTTVATITTPDIVTTTSLNLSECFSTDVWLKYKDGFVNAVRYSIKINKLL
jgi:hypothetical protein